MKVYTVNEQVENAIKWIDGLKTTKVKQTTGNLGNSREGYCCLGYGCMKLKIDYESAEGDNEEFKNAIGLKKVDGHFKSSEQLNKKLDLWEDINISLIDLNDDYNFSFRKISTVIKNHLDSLFIKDVANQLKIYYEK